MSSPTLGGSVCIRNGNDLDFCWREAIASLLPVCDVVGVCDGESTDGTQEEIREWMKREPKIVLCVYPWPNPHGDPEFWVKWLNYSREHLPADWHFQLDADEVVHENSYDEIRRFIETPNRSAVVTRYNFWRDHRHLIPEGECCGKRVIRLAPTRLWLASDGPHPKGDEVANLRTSTTIEIAHYGWLRRRAAFFKKERSLQDMFFATTDPRLDGAEKRAGNWMEDPAVCDWQDRVEDYHGTHPKAAIEWLKERGYHA